MITPTKADIIAKISHTEQVSLRMKYDKMLAHIGIVYIMQTEIESGIYYMEAQYPPTPVIPMRALNTMTFLYLVGISNTNTPSILVST